MSSRRATGPRVRPSRRGAAAGQGDAEGPPGRSDGRARDRASARRPAAAARPADRASAPDPGQLSPDLRRASRGARRRDEAVVCRSVRDRDLLRAFRHGEGRRAGYRAADHSRLQLADLRHAGRGKTAARIAGQRRPRHPRGARALRRPLRYRAGGRSRPSLCRSCHRCERARRGEGRRHPCASARLCRLRRLCRRRRLQAAQPPALRRAGERGSAEGARRRLACAGSAARAFRRGANGARCSASPGRG